MSAQVSAFVRRPGRQRRKDVPEGTVQRSVASFHGRFSIVLVASATLLAGCFECYEEEDLCPTTEERICDRLVECDMLDGTYLDCLRRLEGTEAPLDPLRCEACLSSTDCERLVECDEDACL